MSTINPLTQNLALRQTMLSFAYLAYTGEGITTANPEAVMLASINQALPQITPDGSTTSLANWKVVWGPVAYTLPGSLMQDNMMYVLQNNAAGCTSQYVIAIRGTNFTSEVDWLLEDFNVINTMPWPMPGYAVNPLCPQGAQISESTSIDMNILLGMYDSKPGNTILSFLSSVTANKNSISLCVTGHSLGGVLSSTMALFLLENQATWDGTWNGSTGSSTVSCISFAAPTAGNNLFAQYSDTMFANAAGANGAGNFPDWDATLNATNCDAVRCNYDVAPQAFILSNFVGYDNLVVAPLLTTYGSNINFLNLTGDDASQFDSFELALDAVANTLSTQVYTQVESNAVALPGVFNGTPPPSSGGTFASYIEAFAAQAIWQHSNSYPTLLQMSSLLNSAIIVRCNAPTLSSISYELFSESVVYIYGNGFNTVDISANIVNAGPIQFTVNSVAPYTSPVTGSTCLLMTTTVNVPANYPNGAIQLVTVATSENSTSNSVQLTIKN